MNTEAHADEIENRGFEFLRQGNWREARGCFEEMLALPLSPIRRVKVLRNVMGAYEKDGMREQAVVAGRQALEVIESNRLYETNGGALLRGEIKSHLLRIQGVPVSRLPAFTLLAAYFSGAAIGAAIGSQIVVHSVNIEGPVITDVRYGGAGLGAVLGFFLLDRMFSLVHPTLSTVVGLLNLGLLCSFLFEHDFKKGAVTLSFILLLPAFGYFAVRSYLRGRA